MGNIGQQLLSLVRHLRPGRQERGRRFARLFPRTLPLSDSQSKPIVSELINTFCSALGQRRPARSAVGAGLSTRFSPRVEQLEDRRLLSVITSYVDDPGSYVINSGTKLAGDWFVQADVNIIGKLDAGDTVRWQQGAGDNRIWGTDAFGTIQAAIGDTTDTVNIAPGSYPEALTINKSLTLLGAGVDITTVNPIKPYGYALSVNSPTADVTLRGLTVSNTGLGGILFVGNELTVDAAKIEGGQFGISHSSGTLDVGHSWVRATNSDPSHVGVFVGSGTTAVLHDNDLSDSGGKVIANDDPTAVVDASRNWWGVGVDPGTRVAGSVDYTPWLNTGADLGGVTADGFQGNFSSLSVSAASPQVGSVGRIQEGVTWAAEGGTVNYSGRRLRRQRDDFKAAAPVGRRGCIHEGLPGRFRPWHGWRSFP